MFFQKLKMLISLIHNLFFSKKKILGLKFIIYKFEQCYLGHIKIN